MTTRAGLVETVTAFCQTEQLIEENDKIVIGVSGGPDSVCLLHWFRQVAARYHLQLWVAHLNHSLRGDKADHDAAFVADLARSWNIPCVVEKQDIGILAQQQKANLEDFARQKRYQFLARVALEMNATKIAVAHHANDQAETLLLHLLRGSGLSGLSGIQPAVSMATFEEIPPAGAKALLLIRPFLQTSRAEIEVYCAVNQLPFCIDESNQDSSLVRNRIRHQLLPQLQAYNPQIYRALSRTATLLQAEQALLQTESEEAWQQIRTPSPNADAAFNRARWQALPLALKRETIRRAITIVKGNVADITFDHIEMVLDLLARGHTGQEVHLPGKVRLRLQHDAVELSRIDRPLAYSNRPLLPNTGSISLVTPGITSLGDGSWQVHCTFVEKPELTAIKSTANSATAAYFDADKLGSSLWLRGRRERDRFAPLGLAGHQQSLKRFMINQKIRAEARSRTPLLVDAEDHIHWVCGWRQSHHSRLTPHTERVLRISFELK